MKIRSAVAVTAAFLLTACGGGGQIGDSGSGNSAANKKLVLIPGITAEPFYISMQCGFQDAAKAAGYEFDTQAPAKFDAAQQTPIVTGILASKPAAVLIAPTDDKAMAGPMKQLKDAGIKVVEVDTKLQDTSIALSSISSNNEQGGKLAAETLNKLSAGKTGSVLVLNTKAGTSTTDARAKGFEKGIKSQTGLKYLGQQYSNDDPAKAASIVKSVLAKNPDLKGIFATNLFGAEGSASGLREAGKSGVKIVGFDAGPKQVKDLKDGVVQGLIAQKPAEIGADGVQQAYNALTGKPVQKKIGTGSVALTKDNLAENQQFVYKSSC
jgi:ribose transport system substrate-binding protein